MSLTSALAPCALLFVLTSACEVPRPDGSYVPGQSDAAAQAPDPMDMIDKGELPDLGSGKPAPSDGDDDEGMPDGGGPAPTRDAGDGPGAPPDSPLVALQKKLSGDYWLRLDFYSTADAATVQIDSHTTAFSLARLGLDEGGALKMIDWQCLVSIAQDCRSGCSSAVTNVAEAGGRAYRPAVRSVTLDPASLAWSTSEEWYALGWKGNSSEQPAAVLPAREDDPLIYDPDGGGNGININLSVKASFPVPNVDCTLRVVQKFIHSYAGTASNQALSTGLVEDHGSDQVVLSYGNCPSDSNARQAQPTTLRLARAPTVIDESWSCPSLSAFQQALPAP